MIYELATELDDPGTTRATERDEADLNLRIALALEHIELAPEGLPARSGFIGGPSTLVPSPEFVFARIAERAEAKARKRQELNVEADAAVLVVDLSESDLPSELRHEMYRRKFRETLDPRANEALNSHAAIVFAETAGWHQPFIPWFLNTASGAPAELFALLDRGEQGQAGVCRHRYRGLGEALINGESRPAGAPVKAIRAHRQPPSEHLSLQEASCTLRSK